MNQLPASSAPANPLAPQTVPPVRAISASIITPSDSPGGAAPVADAQTFWNESATWHPDQAKDLMKYAPIPAFLVRRQKLDARRLGAA